MPKPRARVSRSGYRPEPGIRGSENHGYKSEPGIRRSENHAYESEPGIRGSEDRGLRPPKNRHDTLRGFGAPVVVSHNRPPLRRYPPPPAVRLAPKLRACGVQQLAFVAFY
ncbi:unnamed protein product [Sphagnum balticum]